MLKNKTEHNRNDEKSNKNGNDEQYVLIGIACKNLYKPWSQSADCDHAMVCRASCSTAHHGVFGHCDKAGLRNYNVHPSNYLHVLVDSNVAHSKSIAPSAVWYVIVMLQNLQVFMSHNLVGFHRTFYLQFLDWKTTHCRDKFCRNESCPTDDPS